MPCYSAKQGFAAKHEIPAMSQCSPGSLPEAVSLMQLAEDSQSLCKG